MTDEDNKGTQIMTILGVALAGAVGLVIVSPVIVIIVALLYAIVKS